MSSQYNMTEKRADFPTQKKGNNKRSSPCSEMKFPVYPRVARALLAEVRLL